jgi:hypothetical protein
MRRRLWISLLTALITACASMREAAACAVCQSGAPAAAQLPAAGALTFVLDARAGASAVAHLRVDERRFDLAASYQITARFGAEAALPLLWRTVSAAGPGTEAVSLGDAETRVRYLAHRSPSFSLSLFGGAKWPSAPVGTDAAGAPLPSALQPGCSSIAPLAGASATWLFEEWVISGVGQILLPFSIRDAPHPGDSIRLAASAERELTPWLATRAALTLRLETGGNLGADTPDPNSGGAVLYVSTGMVLRPVKRFSASADVAFPVVQGWFGRHRESPVLGAAVALHL